MKLIKVGVLVALVGIFILIVLPTGRFFRPTQKQAKPKEINVLINRQNIRDFVGKPMLVLIKPENPDNEKQAKFQDLIFAKYDRRIYRTGGLKFITELEIKRISGSGECALICIKSWDSKTHKETIDQDWYSTDSFLDVFLFVEVLD